jgi:hypothetical protein
MTRASIGEILDDIVAYHYQGILRSGLRPRLASFSFSPYLRTPVHDLPHDGVGVVALHESVWQRALRARFPGAVDMAGLIAVAVERW